MARKPATEQRGKIRHKVAVVTGGGTGLGRDAANRLVKDGFKVAVVGRRADRLEPHSGEKLLPYPCDVAKPEAIRKTVRTIVRDLDRIDVLVNAAGVVKRESLNKINQETIGYQIDINLVGTINMSLACIPSLKKTKGSIVNYSSTFSERAAPGFLIYCTTKGGIDSFTRALAVEVARYKINVNAVSPGLVRSEIYFNDGAMTKAEYKKYFNTYGKMYPLGRAGEPEEVSELVSYLASDRASWMTGNVIPIDGGGMVA